MFRTEIPLCALPAEEIWVFGIKLSVPRAHVFVRACARRDFMNIIFIRSVSLLLEAAQ